MTSSQVTPPQITFVCCVESGSLENQTVRMVQSLRRYGGRFAKAPIVAVTPRIGPPLDRKTQQIFEQCEVEHLRIRPFERSKQYAWNNFINKCSAVLAVDERVNTEAVAWLDSDLLFVGEPDQLILQPQESFLACTSDQHGATTGSGDALEPYWQALCKSLNIDIETLPWVTTAEEQARIRYYFNGGVFVYRRSSGFAKQYLDNCVRVLEAEICSKVCGTFFYEQISVGLTAAQLNLPWRSLPYSHNYVMSPETHDQWYSEERLRAAKVVHYHASMWMPFWTTFLQCLQKTHPEVAAWVESLGPLQNEASSLNRLIGRVLRDARRKKSATYQAACSVL